MVDISYIFIITEDILLAIALLLTLIFSALILLIPHLRHRNNMIIINICCSIIGSCIFFFIYFTMNYFDPQHLFASQLCILLFYAYNIASIGVPFAFITFTVHRYFYIVYHTKSFFKAKRWVVICIASQWISEFVISLPFVLRQGPYCSNLLWMRTYTCILVIVVPSMITIVLNALIFLHVRSSTRRVQPHTMSTTTNGVMMNQKTRVGRREIALLRHMIFIFSIFLIGWSPIYLVNVINQFITVATIPNGSSILLCEVALISLIINLFMCNHQLRQYLSNKIRVCFIHE
ncbi:unnamed protein product [Adineta steineri]|uniref:G-protein coupled receptors family 1 profile domain-containing protein n=1 Tax=Adineta steineri TaxID=433720 RepID=A0A819CDA8_9BILA|nr:unnamed protein product [Adineta steineri]